MAFENHKDEIEKSLNKEQYFRAQPFSDSHPSSLDGNRRIAKSVSLRPDLVKILYRIAKQRDLSFSNLCEKVLMDYVKSNKLS